MITLGSIKSQAAKVLTVCPDDARVVEYLNRAEDVLISLGKWRGTVVNYRICAPSACLTWPRQIETIEAWAACDLPHPIRNGWYEFLSYHTGIQSDLRHTGPHLIDRGLACAFDDVRWNGATPPQLKVYADDAGDSGKRVLIKFVDSNGNKVYSEEPALSGNFIEGVYVTLVAPPAYATAVNSSGTPYTVLQNGLYEVQKPVTNQVLRLYAYDPVLFTQYPLGYYEPSETLPEYRRSFVPGLMQMGSCCLQTSNVCQQPSVTARVKLRHLDVSVDTDSFVLTSREAILKGVDAIQTGEPPQSNAQGSAALMQAAVGLLQAELKNFQGDGAIVVPKFQSQGTFGAGYCSLNSSHWG